MSAPWSRPAPAWLHDPTDPPPSAPTAARVRHPRPEPVTDMLAAPAPNRSPDGPVEPAPALRDAVAERVARIAPHLPPAAREALVSARVRFLARWSSDRRHA